MPVRSQAQRPQPRRQRGGQESASRRCRHRGGVTRAESVQLESQVENLTPTCSRISALASSSFQGEESGLRAFSSSPRKGEVDSAERSDGESGGGRNSRRPEHNSLWPYSSSFFAGSIRTDSPQPQASF